MRATSRPVLRAAVIARFGGLLALFLIALALSLVLAATTAQVRIDPLTGGGRWEPTGGRWETAGGRWETAGGRW